MKHNKPEKQHQKVTSSIEVITPEDAKAILELDAEARSEHDDIRNRTLSMHHSNNLAAAMKREEWVMNGETLKIDDRGAVIDGQHRLTAVMISGIPCEFMVVRGLPSSHFSTIDRGMSRTNGQIFSCEKIPNSNLVAAIIKNVINYRRSRAANNGKGGSMNSNIKPSADMLLREYHKHQECYAWAASLGARCRKRAKPTPVGTLSAIARIDAGNAEEYVEGFWVDVEEGDGLRKYDPAHTLRERLATLNQSKFTTPSFHLVFCLSAKAWNAFVLGKKVKLLRHTEGEPAPEIL